MSSYKVKLVKDVDNNILRTKMMRNNKPLRYIVTNLIEESSNKSCHTLIVYEISNTELFRELKYKLDNGYFNKDLIVENCRIKGSFKIL